MATTTIICIGLRGRLAKGDDTTYALGIEPARYPLPAIREWYEWGRDFISLDPVLLHVYQGPYNG